MPRSRPAASSRATLSPRRTAERLGTSSTATRYLTRVTSLKIGRYMAMTRPPMTTPRNTIIIGSSRAGGAGTAGSPVPSPARSTTRLPAVRAVMRRPSRIGTPDETSVPRVRVKRATDTFRISVPNTGSLSTRGSLSDRPPSVLSYARAPAPTPVAPRHFFDYTGAPLAPCVGDPHRRSDLDQVHVQLVEGLRVPPEGVGEGGSCLHASGHPGRHRAEGLRFALLGQDRQALHQGKPRVHHRGELAGEDRHLLVLDLAAEAPTDAGGPRRPAGLFLVLGDQAGLAAQLRDGGRPRGRFDLAGGGALGGAALRREERHC